MVSVSGQLTKPTMSLAQITQRIKNAIPLSKVHGKEDDYNEQYKDSKNQYWYEQARKKLENKPYSLRMKPLYLFLNGYAFAYHIISILLALATCVGIAYIFGGGSDKLPTGLTVFIAILVGVILAAILVAIEMAKHTLADNIFKSKAKKESVGGISLIAFCFLLFLSIAFSGVGGALISYLTSNKSYSLESQRKLEKATTSKGYDSRLKQLNQVITGLENLSVDKKARKWGLTKKEQKNLEVSKAEKTQIIATKEKSLRFIDDKYDKQIASNGTTTYTIMWLVLSIVTILELVTTYAYYFKYQYLSRTEFEGVTSHILEEHVTGNNPVTSNNAQTGNNRGGANTNKVGEEFVTIRVPKRSYQPEPAADVVGTEVTVVNEVDKPAGFPVGDNYKSVPKKKGSTGKADALYYLTNYYYVARMFDAGYTYKMILEATEGSPGMSTIQKVKQHRSTMLYLGKYDEIMGRIEEDIEG